MALILMVSLALSGLAASAEEEQQKRVKVINAGIGGNNTRDALARIDADVFKYQPDMLILDFGGNDCCWPQKFVPLDEYEKNLRKLIALSRQNGVKAIVLMTPPPAIEAYILKRHPDHPQAGNLGAHILTYVEAVRKIAAEEKLLLVDLYEIINAHGGAVESADTIVRNMKNGGGLDGIHINAEGYKIVAAEVHEKIKDYVTPASVVVCFGASLTAGAHVKGFGTASWETYPGQLKYLLDPQALAEDEEAERKERASLEKSCLTGFLLDDEMTDFWQTHKNHHPDRVSLDTTVAYRGKASLRQEGGVDDWILTASKFIPVTPGKRYSLGAAIRKSRNTDKIFLAIRTKDAEGNWTTSHTLGRETVAEGVWKLHEVSFVATGNEISLYIYNTKSNVIGWFDAISLREVAPEGTCVCRKLQNATDWEQADMAAGFMQLSSNIRWPVKSFLNTQVRLLHDENNIYLKATLPEETGYRRKAEFYGQDEPVYRDDSLELFFFTGNDSYFQICVNANGAVFDACKQAGREIDASWQSGVIAEIEEKNSGWEATVTIPKKSLPGLAAENSNIINVNFGRNHAGGYYSWALTEAGKGYASGAVEVLLSEQDYAPGKTVSPYAAAIREAGIISNPDFSGDDAGLYQWRRENDSYFQPAKTRVYVAGESIEFFAQTDKQPSLRLELQDSAGKTEAVTVELKEKTRGVYVGEFRFEQPAAIVGLTLGTQGKPIAFQAGGAGVRCFSHSTKLYPFVYHKNDQALEADTLEVFSLYPHLSLVQGQPSPLAFIIANNLAAESLRNTTKETCLLLDLPAGIELYSDTLFEQRIFAEPVEEASPHGDDYRRYRLQLRTRFAKRDRKTQSAVPYFITHDATVAKAVYYSLRYCGRESTEKSLPVDCLPPAPKVKPLKRLMTGLYLSTWHSDKPASGTIFSDPQAPEIFQSFADAGLNTIFVKNILSLKQIDDPKLDALVKVANCAGLTCGMCTGDFFHWRKLSEEALAKKADGSAFGNTLCPSYRGKEYREMIATWGNAANHGMYLVDHDFELWNYHEHEICFCDRCKDKFKAWLLLYEPDLAYADPAEFETRPEDAPALHKAWNTFKTEMLAQWHRDLQAELQRNMTAAGVPGQARVAITKLRDAKCFDWQRMLKQGDISYLSSMIYAYSSGHAEPTIENCAREFLKWRQLDGVDRFRDIITIAPAEINWGEAVVPDKGMYYQVLEVFGSGAAGFKIWHGSDMNGGKYHWLARALGVVQPVENILYSGELRTISAPDAPGRIRLFSHPAGEVAFVSDYRLGKRELFVPVPIAEGKIVVDLEKGSVLPGGAEKTDGFKVVFDNDDCAKMYFIGSEEQWRAL
jgi:lysophospholipase L1-like esterase